MTTATAAATAVRTDPEGLERPPGLIFLLATCVAAGFALEANTRDNMIGFFVSFVAWVVIFTVWLVRLLFLAAPQSRKASHWKLRWALPMLILLGATILMATGVPTRVRFEASRPAFDQLATDVMAGGSTDIPSVGLYDIELLERTSDGVRFLVLGSGFIDVTGFAFSTDGDPSDPDNSEDVYRPLGGGWYQWTRVF